MANSKYEYVRTFEQPDILLPDTWIVVRIDGRGFHKLSEKYKFEKPNDLKALELMNKAAEAVLESLPDISLSYGQSDEYSFVFAPGCQLYERRAGKLSSTVVSMFTAAYVFHWSSYFPDRPLSFPLPSFDGRAVVYPTMKHLKDYLNWRQADCHINNLYNTTFWTLVNRGGMTRTAAETRLSGTLSADKNNILFEDYGINYNTEPEMLKRGTLIYRDYVIPSNGSPSDNDHGQPSSTTSIPAANDSLPATGHTQKPKVCITVAHNDIIGTKGDIFWQEHPWLGEYGNARKRAAEVFFRTKNTSRS